MSLMVKQQNPRTPIPVALRFWPKVEKSADCWTWLGARDTHGYGRVYVETLPDGRKRLAPAHRVAYSLVKGPIPDGLDLDHLCRNPACVRPDHLEPVTHRENIMRGNFGGDSATRAAWTHCKHGHEFTDENTLQTPAGRNCRTCRRAQERARYHARRAA